MQDPSKTKQELIEELSVLKEKIKKLENFESERKEAEEALRESERRMKLALEGTDQGLWEWDILSRKVVYDENWQRIMNLPSEGRYVDMDKWLASMDAGGRAAFEIKMTDYLADRARYYELEHRLQTGNKDWKWIWTRGIATERDPSGIPLRMIGTYRDITKHKQQVEVLRESEEKYRLIVKYAPAGIYEIDFIENRIKTVNAMACQMLGYTEAELMVMSPMDIIDKESLLIFLDRIKKAQAGEPLAEDVEYKGTRKDGSEMWAILHNSFKYNKGQIIGAFVVAHDITGRKRAEEALHESEERHRRIVEALTDAVLLRAGDTIIYANPAALKLFRANDPSDLLGKRYLDLVHPDDRAISAERIKKNMADNSIAPPREHRVLALDGQAVHVESIGFTITYQGETQVFGVFREITERKRIEEELKKSEERFRLAYSTSPDAININRMQDGLYVDINDGFTQLTGYTREDVIGRTSLEINVWCNPADRQELIHRLKETGSCENLEAEFRRKDGSVTTALMSARIIVLQDVPHILSITRDISDRKRVEEEKTKLQDQLLQSQKMESVGRLAGGVAHDFNNMLGVILGHVEMAMEEVDPTQPLHADLEEIRKAANRSTELTRQLLAFARKQTVSPKVLDLNETVEGMLKMLRRLIGEDIQLAWLPCANLWPIRMDPSQIDQILANLSVNSRDAIFGVGKVTIETQNVPRPHDEAYCVDPAGRIPGDYVLLAVSDDGCGMDKEIQSKLFEPFFTTKETGKGTGLGLATVYGIVKQNNGFIDVYSEPGQGTTFKVYLPRHIGKVEKAQMLGQLEPVMPGHETILVVEDEPALLELSKSMLEKQGYRVLTAATPGEAIHLAEEYTEEIHLLMTDVVMPEMNGRELAKTILFLYPNMRRLFMSGYTADVIAHHGVLDEGVHFLQKPFSRAALAAKVREALEGVA